MSPLTELRRAIAIVREAAEYIHGLTENNPYHESPTTARCSHPVCRQFRVKLASFYTSVGCLNCGNTVSVLIVDQHDPYCDGCLAEARSASDLVMDPRD